MSAVVSHRQGRSKLNRRKLLCQIDLYLWAFFKLPTGVGHHWHPQLGTTRSASPRKYCHVSLFQTVPAHSDDGGMTNCPKVTANWIRGTSGARTLSGIIQQQRGRRRAQTQVPHITRARPVEQVCGQGPQRIRDRPSASAHSSPGIFRRANKQLIRKLPDRWIGRAEQTRQGLLVAKHQTADGRAKPRTVTRAPVE